MSKLNTIYKNTKQLLMMVLVAPLLVFNHASVMAAETTNSQVSMQVLSSVKPLALMQKDLGLGWQEPLVPVGITPHDFSLRASHVKRLQEADLVIWLGPEIEPYLSKIMSRKPAHQQLILAPESVLLEDYTTADEEHHDHHHDHDDLHPWTSPEFVRLSMALTVQIIAKVEADVAQHLQARWLVLEQKLVQQELYWQNYFQQHPVAYINYHDALGPYEESMGISSQGSLADASGSQAGIKNLQKLFKLIAAEKVQCILVDAEANQALVQKLARQGAGQGTGKGLEQVDIDLLAWHVEPGKENMWRYFDSLGKAFQRCEY